jgi:hypothetical protein
VRCVFCPIWWSSSVDPVSVGVFAVMLVAPPFVIIDTTRTRRDASSEGDTTISPRLEHLLVIKMVFVAIPIAQVPNHLALASRIRSMVHLLNGLRKCRGNSRNRNIFIASSLRSGPWKRQPSSYQSTVPHRGASFASIFRDRIRGRGPRPSGMDRAEQERPIGFVVHRVRSMPCGGVVASRELRTAPTKVGPVGSK